MSAFEHRNDFSCSEMEDELDDALREIRLQRERAEQAERERDVLLRASWRDAMRQEVALFRERAVLAERRESGLREALEGLRDEAFGLAPSLLAIQHHLETPYPDAPHLTPWTRFVEPALRRLLAARIQARVALEDVPAGPPYVRLSDTQAGQVREALADALQLLAKFEYLPYGADVARRVVDGVWITDDEVASECNLGEHRCPTCGWPQRGHRGAGRYKGNAENTHEEGCSLRAVLDGEPAPRLRRLTTRAAALASQPAGRGRWLSAAETEQVREALRRLNEWASAMPDAGFTSESPRWRWWAERPRAQVRAALAVLAVPASQKEDGP